MMKSNWLPCFDQATRVTYQKRQDKDQNRKQKTETKRNQLSLCSDPVAPTHPPSFYTSVFLWLFSLLIISVCNGIKT